MLEWLGRISPGKSAKIPNEFKLDIRWWATFLESFNGISMMPTLNWSQTDKLVIDASQGGCAAICNKQFWFTQYPAHIAENKFSAAELEILTTVAAVRCWGVHLQGSRIAMFCDSAQTAEAVNPLRSKRKNALRLMRLLLYELAIRQVEIKMIQINSQNRVVDWLSKATLEHEYLQKFNSWNKVYDLVNINCDVDWFNVEAKW
jgi:hypothetical protein